MKHYGDITKLSGYELPVVDCITGGSPCQDLSVAGKRAGLDGERSGLFMEQIRIVKEMRERDRMDGRAGRFIRPRWMVWENVPGAFSSNGGEDFRTVLEETARIADPSAVIPRPAKWTPSGCILGDGWSIAWRVHDAQFWGTAQRRKRIALVGDFGGGCAPEVLFERKSLQGDSEQSGEERQGAAGCAAESTEIASKNLIGSPILKYIMLEYHPNDSRINIDGTGTCQSLTTRMGTGGNNVPLVIEIREDVRTVVRRLTPLDCERLQRFPDGWTDIGEWKDTKGKLHKESSDSARYKALGNSIATPFWFYLMRRISATYERPATLGSLFDGIGGFPYCWERCNGKGTAVWASEIEEFPIAVTKYHFPEEGKEDETN